jgi:quinate dehydrogenase
LERETWRITVFLSVNNNNNNNQTVQIFETMGYTIQPKEDTLQLSYAYGSSPLSSDSLKQPLKTFLFGYPIAHSMAPILHNTLFEGLEIPWTYNLNETPDSTMFLPALQSSNIIGCAVTMPYKVTLAPLVDAITEEARTIGAINTVFIRKSETGAIRYIGTNTDCIGVREAFLQNYPNVLTESTGKPALVIGGGGACRSAVYALWKWLGASKIYLVNRLEFEVTDIMAAFEATGFQGELVHVRSVGQAIELETPALVVGTVPDFPPKEKGEILAREIAEAFLGKAEKGYILEMCYHPKPRTAFFELAEKAGWKVLPGTEAMMYQGIAQQVLWTEIPLEKFPIEQAKRVIREALMKH